MRTIILVTEWDETLVVECSKKDYIDLVLGTAQTTRIGTDDENNFIKVYTGHSVRVIRSLCYLLTPFDHDVIVP